MEANDYYLSQYLRNEEKAEKALENFLDNIYDEVQEIKDIIFELEQKAKDYEVFDFSEELKIELKDLLC